MIGKANLEYLCGSCQAGMDLICKAVFISIYEIIPDVVVDKNGVRLEIVYHSYVAEKTWFLEDLFRQTKGLRTLQGGRIRGVAYTLTEIQYPYPSQSFWVMLKKIGYYFNTYKIGRSLVMASFK